MARFESPVHEMMWGNYFYESTSVNKSRKDKYCDLCGDLIPKGSASNGAKLFSDSYHDVTFCKSCEKTYTEELELMRNGKLDCPV